MELSGIYPAIVTPFDSDGVFVQYAFERHIESLYNAGVDGLYVLGQTGEGALQSVAARKQVLEAALKASPSSKHIVVHVGATTTKEAVDLARHAESVGAYAVSSLPPPGAYDYTEIREYYEILAASNGLPLLVYHHPDTCPEITPERALDLCSIPNVIGFKFTDFNLYLLSLIRDRGKVVFNGKDEQLAAGLLMGANGGIGTFYNIFPKLFVSIFELASKGEWTQAAALQRRLNPILYQIFLSPLVPAVRELLEAGGFSCGECLSPRRRLRREERGRLRELAATLPTDLAPYFLRA